MTAIETYRKEGRVVRFERSGEGSHLVRIEECGVAIERDLELETFAADASATLDEPDPANVVRIANEIAALIVPPLAIERLIVSEGCALHDFESDAYSMRWTERSERIHLALAHPTARTRALVDLGAFDALAEVRDVADALARFTSVPPDASSAARVRLHPRVTATLLPTLARVAVASVRQTSHADIRIDGKGRPIELMAIEQTGVWPNWYRPSYRLRPVRLPFHLDLKSDAPDARSDDLPQAVALTAPVELRDDVIRMHLLMRSGDDSFARIIDLPLRDLPRCIEAIGAEASWYPYAAGTWGRDVVIAR